MNGGSAEVDLAFTAVLGQGHESRLVVRRSVCARTDDGREVSVQELWVSTACPSPFDAADTVHDVISGCGRDLVRGRPVGALPRMESPSTAQLTELCRTTAQRTVGVEYLAGYRGTVEGLEDGRPVLRDGDVVATGGFLAAQVRRLLVGVLRALAVPQCPPSDAAPGPAGGASPTGRTLDQDVVRADLLRDLADARLRLEQERGFALLADTRLEYVLGARPAPGWSRAIRRTLDGAVVESCDQPDPERDAVVVVFVSGRGGRVDLFRYGVDPRIDLPGVLGDPRVRGAFAVCAARPDDSVAQTRAVTALRIAAAEPGAGDRRPDPDPPDAGRVVPTTGTLVPTKESLDGVIVLHDCRGIEAGNNDRRFNSFAYVFTPTDTTGELLRGVPEIVRTIVGHSCRIDDAATGRVRNALAAAVCAGEGPT